MRACLCAADNDLREGEREEEPDYYHPWTFRSQSCMGGCGHSLGVQEGTACGGFAAIPALESRKQSRRREHRDPLADLSRALEKPRGVHGDLQQGMLGEKIHAIMRAFSRRTVSVNSVTCHFPSPAHSPSPFRASGPKESTRTFTHM